MCLMVFDEEGERESRGPAPTIIKPLDMAKSPKPEKSINSSVNQALSRWLELKPIS